MDWQDIGLLLIKAFIIANVVMVVFALMTWLERRLLSWFQYRIGPNRVGPFGLLQPIADLMKLIRKEAFRPRGVNAWLYLLAPVASLAFALSIFSVIPFAPDVTIPGAILGLDLPSWLAGESMSFDMAADLNVALLFVLAMSSLGAYGVIVGGWASNSKFSLLGGLRAAAQLISYEVAMAVAILPVVMMTSTLALDGVVEGTGLWEIGGFSPWFIVWAPVGFVVFLLSAIAESNRAPFNFAEAEEEIVGGFHTEYGGLRYALFANAEYVHMLAVSAVGVTLFLGGYQGWGVDAYPLLGLVWFMFKMSLFLFLFIWIRATVPRLRYDRLMRLGWKVLLPAATVQFIVTAAIVANQWGYTGGPA